ncbi:RNA 2'-phosphotransferase [Actinokineospora enzanensis]|uniref:RNA 2'-phosphotransferase n=1 Tax=Actinokineospora enzanensis TaxID=155975 RepID=UPI0003748247|nr:RNA 2'-phosphotransferase [Actinokineospora enzanensis]
MEDKNIIRLSKRLALVLRHNPDSIGITLDPAGWVPVEELLAALRAHGTRVDRPLLERVVAENNKARYAFDETGTRIRASQGHSVSVDLGLAVAEPPETLYHGTVAAALPAIQREGLRPMRRHAVHLSANRETAVTVGARRGKPVVLAVAAAEMVAVGHEFQLSANGVWLTPHVPADYLTVTST